MSAPTSKEEFLRLVKQTRADLDALLARFSDEQFLQPDLPGGWTLKDVLAHITWHEREMIGLIKARALVGSDWWELPTEERNQRIYEEYKDKPLTVVRAEAEQVYQIFLAELETLSLEELLDANLFKDMPPEWQPWDLIAGNAHRHYQDHIRDIRQAGV